MIRRVCILFAFALLFSCEKEELPGNVTITVSYYYNQYVGYKPDVGASASLFSNTSVLCEDLVDALFGVAYIDSVRYEADYTGEADVSGEIRLNNIPAGSYYLAVASKGRFTFSDKIIDVPPGGELDLVKNFSYYHEFEKDPW